MKSGVDPFPNGGGGGGAFMCNSGQVGVGIYPDMVLTRAVTVLSICIINNMKLWLYLMLH